MLLTKRDIPNALTILRLVLAVAFFAMLACATGESRPLLIASAAVFAIAALTDALDGHLARRWNAISAFGRVMDPFADKILVLGAFVMLAGPNFVLPPAPAADGASIGASPIMLTGVASWMPVLILGRELLITSIRGVYEARGVDFSASLSGKAKMVIQSLAVPAILLIAAYHAPIGPAMAAHLNAVIAWVVVGVTALSAWPYLVRAFMQRRMMQD